ncbi:MAG: SDR family oxidoreductase [Bacteroidia bacterium]|nr:SDR family oxidoreductase [Bacteroidia bacterium]
MAAFTEKVVWITGASSGIGEALSYEFAKQGASLVLSARREAELQRVKNNCPASAGEILVLPLDLSQPATFTAAFEQVIQALGQVDVLVNNAGFSQRSLTRDTSTEVDRKVMEVDFFGQTALSKTVLPSMLKRGSGHFVVMSSLTGKFGFPYRSAYAAAKHALQGFFETLYLEESRNGIKVTIVNPGGIKTAISENAVTADGGRHGVMDPLQAEGMSAERCAKLIVGAVKAGKFELVVGNTKEKMSVFLKKIFPPLFHKIVRLKP